MDSHNKPTSLDEIIHKERSKEKLKVKGLKPLDQRPQAKGLKENTTVHRQMQMSNGQQPEGLSAHRLRKLRENAEIDKFLNTLFLEDMINQEYWNFHAKAIHVLGLSLCNQLAINSRNGYNKQRLYASKVKGALQLHYKEEYERDRLLQSRLNQIEE